jgi:hypothetical protein
VKVGILLNTVIRVLGQAIFCKKIHKINITGARVLAVDLSPYKEIIG